MVLLVGFAIIFLLINGLEYYRTGLEERAFSPDHDTLKPSGVMGHGLGIIRFSLDNHWRSQLHGQKKISFYVKNGIG